jgi:hypothetical protein
MRHPNRRGNVAIWLPNILTYLRIAAVPLVVGLLIYGGEVNRWIALGIFIAAAITDFFDGYLARIWQQQSSLGRMLDPIADKLLIASVLLAVTYAGQIAGLHIWAAVIILCREILVSGSARVSGRASGVGAGHAACQVEDHNPDGRHCLSHRRPGRRPDHSPDLAGRADLFVDRSDCDALHRAGLFPGRAEARHG